MIEKTLERENKTKVNMWLLAFENTHVARSHEKREEYGTPKLYLLNLLHYLKQSRASFSLILTSIQIAGLALCFYRHLEW